MKLSSLDNSTRLLSYLFSLGSGIYCNHFQNRPFLYSPDRYQFGITLCPVTSASNLRALFPAFLEISQIALSWPQKNSFSFLLLFSLRRLSCFAITTQCLIFVRFPASMWNGALLAAWWWRGSISSMRWLLFNGTQNDPMDQSIQRTRTQNFLTVFI